MTATAELPAQKFKLLRGRHVEKAQDGGRKTYIANDPKNNIVESRIDLETRFGPKKFQNLDRVLAHADSALQRQIDELQAENKKLKKQLNGENVDEGQKANGESKTDGTDEYNLRDMSVAELRKFADEMEVDLGTATKKDEIINTIQSALDAQ